MRYLSAILVVLLVPSCLLGCASIVEPGQTQQEMEESGALKWAVAEYDAGVSHFVWIPHWTEGLVNLSSPRASNCKSMDVLEFNVSTGKLAAVHVLGRDRERWVDVLRAHGRIKSPEGGQGFDQSYNAIALRDVQAGATLEAVLFAYGFPRVGPDSSPNFLRCAADLRKDSDVLYYFRTQGGSAFEVVIQGGRVSELRPARSLNKAWIPFYHPIIIP